MKRFAILGRLTLSIAVLAMLALPVAADQDRPWKGRGTGVVTGVSAGVVSIAFWGQSSHLGRYTAEGAHVVAAPGVLAGVATLVAANGDEVDVVYEFTFDPLVFVLPMPIGGTMTVVGGTGRFAGASGFAEVEGMNNGDGTFSLSWEGTIAY